MLGRRGGIDSLERKKGKGKGRAQHQKFSCFPSCTYTVLEFLPEFDCLQGVFCSPSGSFNWTEEKGRNKRPKTLSWKKRDKVLYRPPFSQPLFPVSRSSVPL